MKSKIKTRSGFFEEGKSQGEPRESVDVFVETRGSQRVECGAAAWRGSGRSELSDYCK